MNRSLAAIVALTLALAPAAAADEGEEEEEKGAKDAERADEEAADASEDAKADAEEDARDAKEGDDEARDASEDEREVKVEVSNAHAVIKLEREAGDVEDEVKIDYDAAEAVMKIEYKSENASAESENELKVEFREVVEYADANGNGAFDPDVDEAVATYRADEDLEWTLTGPMDVVSADGAAGKRLVGAGAFPGGGRLVLTLSTFGAFAEVNGTDLRPTDAKIDIVVDAFPWTRNDTAVALFVKVERKAEAESEREEGASGNVTGVETVANGFATYFTWAETADVDGVSTPVRTTLVESESKSDGDESELEEKFYFSYARGDLINHDPVLGVSAASSETRERSLVPGPSAALGLAALGAVALALASRRKGL